MWQKLLAAVRREFSEHPIAVCVAIVTVTVSLLNLAAVSLRENANGQSRIPATSRAPKQQPADERPIDPPSRAALVAKIVQAIDQENARHEQATAQQNAKHEQAIAQENTNHKQTLAQLMNTLDDVLGNLRATSHGQDRPKASPSPVMNSRNRAAPKGLKAAEATPLPR
jgi:hypothetical protein